MGRASRIKKEVRQINEEMQKPVIDDWTDMDRTYFEKNPTKKYYFREPTINEMKQTPTIPDKVKVTLIAEGVRARELMFNKTKY